MENQRQLEQMLQQVLEPNADRTKITATLEEHGSDPEFGLTLLKIVLASDASADVRQLAAVEARKHVDAFWPKIDHGPKPEVRTALLNFALSNDSKLLRRATADIVVEIAAIELSDPENRQWADLPGLLFQGTKSGEARHREMSLHIIYQLMVDQPDLFAGDLMSILGVVASAIQDPDSIEARVNALLIFGEVAVLVDPDEDEPTVSGFQESVPRMIGVLKESIDSGDEELAVKCFEVFHNTIEIGSAFFNSHFQVLMDFIIMVMSNKEVDQEIRLQAIFFLTQAVSCRKMKIQALRIGESIAVKALHVVIEIDEFDDEGEQNPARQALGLLDILAASLPPSQVVLPLMKYVGEFSSHAEPAVRRAGILGLGMCVEGAPDFFSTQLKELIPLVLRLLGDPEAIVRGAALQTVSRLAEELCDEIGALHETIVPAIIKNFDFAATSLASQTGKAAEQTVQILLDCCVAIDSIMDGLDKEDATMYQKELVPRLNKLLTEDHSKMKLCAVAAIGSIAEAAEEGFLPYFKDAMNSLGPYMNQKEDTEDLNIRRIVTDAMGRIAVAVGREAFQPYVAPLMRASEEALQLEDEELRESSYILWSYMVKVYGEDFEPFLDGVVKGLFVCLDQEEESMTLDADSEDALEKIVARINGNKKLSDKRLKDVDISELLLAKGAEMETIDVEDDDDVESIGLGPATAISMEKEIAVGVMGDVLAYSKAKFLPYFPKTVEMMVTMAHHPYHGVRQSAVETLLRAYESLWQIETDKGMEKWKPGLPLKVEPTADLKQLGAVVMEATLAMWEDQDERNAVTCVNKKLMEVIELSGPAILVGDDTMKKTFEILLSILHKKHACQISEEEDGFESQEVEESSEYDWLVIESAMDCIVAIAKALGSEFTTLWKECSKPILKYASSSDPSERAAATGTLAELILALDSSVTPFTAHLLKTMMHRMTDEDRVTKANAIYAIGLLCALSADQATTVGQYGAIFRKLEPLLSDDSAAGHLLDNAAGCVARMIIAKPDKVPLAEVLPRLVELMPTKEDYEVNGPLFQCIVRLYQQENPVVQQLTPQVMTAIQKISQEPEDHLDDKTRGQLKELVHYLETMSS